MERYYYSSSIYIPIMTTCEHTNDPTQTVLDVTIVRNSSRQLKINLVFQDKIERLSLLNLIVIGGAIGLGILFGLKGPQLFK